MNRSQALETARAHKLITGDDWVVFYDQCTGHHWVQLREQPKTVEVMIVELCVCGQCRPGQERCVIANVSNAEAAQRGTVERAPDGEPLALIDAFASPFDASKLDDLDRHEKTARAATPGPWHRGAWDVVADAPRLVLDLRSTYDENDRDLRVSASLYPHAKKDPWFAKSTIIGGCGCCNSPHGRDVDGEHIVANAPDVALQLNARAKLLARLVELSERWLIALLNTPHESTPWRLVLTSKNDSAQRVYISADFERLINHAWANAPDGVC